MMIPRFSKKVKIQEAQLMVKICLVGPLAQSWLCWSTEFVQVVLLEIIMRCLPQLWKCTSSYLFALHKVHLHYRGDIWLCWNRGGQRSLFFNNAMFFTMRCFPILNDAIFRRFFKKNIDFDVFDDVWKKPKHRINDASNDVNRPPLTGCRYWVSCSSTRTSSASGFLNILLFSCATCFDQHRW